MALNDKWLVGGTKEISFGESSWNKKVTVPKAVSSTAEYTYGNYVHDNWPSKAEDQVNLVDASYAYCAADSNFAMQKGVLYNCGYSGYTANRNKKYALTNEEEMPIGFSHIDDLSTYQNIGIYGGDRASNKLNDHENTPLNNYLDGSYIKQAGKVYGGGQVPIVRGLTFKDVVVVPIIMSYKLTSGKDPAVATKEEMQNIQYRLSSVDAFLHKEYMEFPYIMGVYAAVINVNTADKTLKTGFSTGPKIQYMINGKWTIDIEVFDDGVTPITYYPVYGDENSNAATLDGWYTWNGSESNWNRVMSMHPYRIMGYYNNGNEWKQPLIRIDGSSPNYSSTGKLILTGDWIKTDLLTVSSSEHWVKIYSDRITEANVEAFCEYVRRQIAYLGCVFSCNGLIEEMDYRFIDDESYMGVIDGDGKTHGDYTRGLENTKNPQYDWTDPINDTPFKPGGGGGPTSGGDKDKEKSEYGGAAFGGYNINVFDFGLNRYIVDQVGYGVLEQFYKQCLDYDGARKRFIAGAMTEGASADDAAKYWEDRFKDRAEYQAKMYSELGYGSDPRNNMVSVMALPFGDTTITPLDTTGVSPKVGYNTMATKFTTELAVGAGTVKDIQYAPGTFGPTPQTDLFDTTKFKQPKYDVFVVNMGEITVKHPKDWNDFRASEPYSRCELYIPYHGNIALNLNQVLGKKIKVQLHIDLLSGSSYAVVTCNGALYQALPGQVGFQMPFTIEGSTTNASALANLSAQSQTNKLQSSNNLLNGVINTVGAVVDTNPGAALSSIIGTFQSAKQLGINERTINFNLAHACDGKSVANATTPITAMSAEGNCQLIWHYPLMLAYNDSQYANLVGYACQRTGTLSSFRGYTQCNNANLSQVNCTEEEKGMILAQLQNGVVIV